MGVLNWTAYFKIMFSAVFYNFYHNLWHPLAELSNAVDSLYNTHEFLIVAGPIPQRVREAPVPIVNDNECVRKINTVTEKIFILPASSFCAGGEEGHDACQVSPNFKENL